MIKKLAKKLSKGASAKKATTKNTSAKKTKAKKATTKSSAAKRTTVKKKTSVKRTAKKAPRKTQGKNKTGMLRVTREQYSAMVAERAYYNFVNRGCSHGNDIADWQEAEHYIAGIAVAK